MPEAVIEAIIAALRDAGLNVTAAFPDGAAPGSAGALVCVGMDSCQVSSSGCGEYLGTETGGSAAELYGYRAEVTAALDVYAPTAAECAGAGDGICAALGKLPSGLKMRAFSCAGTEFDELTGAFRRRCALKCLAYLTRSADAETGEFTDFILRGAVKG